MGRLLLSRPRSEKMRMTPSVSGCGKRRKNERRRRDKIATARRMEKTVKKKEDEEMVEEKKEEQEKEEAAAPAELSEEEKQLWYRKSTTPDLSESVLAKSYAKFSIPTAEEGFDEITYVWQPKEKCEEHLRAWMLDQKRTQRAEDLEPSDWFKEELEKWKKTLMDWKKRQSDFKDPVKRKYAQK